MDTSFYYKEFFKSQQRDVKCLKFGFEFSKFVGVTPITFKKTLLQKIFFTILILGPLVFIFFNGYLNVSWALMVMNIPDQLLLAWMGLSEFCYMTATLTGGNLFYENNWSRLFTFLYRMEVLTQKLNLASNNQNGLHWLYSKLFIVSISCIPFHFYQIYVLLELKAYPTLISNIGWLMVDGCSVGVLSLLISLNTMLTWRYQFLGKCLQSVVWSKEEKTGLAQMKLLLKMYRVCYYVMKEVQAVFGWHVYFYIIKVQNVVVCLVSNNLLAEMGERAANQQMDQNLVYSIIYTICLTLLIMSFDGVETNGKKFIKTCYVLHESCESPLMRAQLLQMAKFAEKWKPSFSAAGFYTVNQLTLSSIFQSTIKYLVALMQLNLALK